MFCKVSNFQSWSFTCQIEDKIYVYVTSIHLLYGCVVTKPSSRRGSRSRLVFDMLFNCVRHWQSVSVPWLLMRMFIGIWPVMASRLCCSALCSSRWWSSAGSAIFFSGGSPASSLSLSCSRATTWAAIAAWAAAACTAATEWPAKAAAGSRAIPTPGKCWPPSSSDQRKTMELFIQPRARAVEFVSHGKLTFLNLMDGGQWGSIGAHWHAHTGRGQLWRWKHGGSPVGGVREEGAAEALSSALPPIAVYGCLELVGVAQSPLITFVRVQVLHVSARINTVFISCWKSK